MVLRRPQNNPIKTEIGKFSRGSAPNPVGGVTAHQLHSCSVTLRSNVSLALALLTSFASYNKTSISNSIQIKYIVPIGDVERVG